MGYDGKYGQVSTERKDIPDDEPVIVIRAQDGLSLRVLEFYRDLVTLTECGQEHRSAVAATYARFEAWQVAHPERVKAPDTQPGEYQ
jgi:hypothetical protein